MGNLKVATKLIISFTIVAVLALVIAVFNIYNMINLSQIAEQDQATQAAQAEELARSALEKQRQVTMPLNYMVEFSIAYGNVRSATRDIGRVRGVEETQRRVNLLTNNMNTCIQMFRNYLATFEGNVYDEDEYRAVREVYEALLGYWQICLDKLIPAGMADDEATVLEAIFTDLAPTGFIIRDRIEFLTGLKLQQTEDWVADASFEIAKKDHLTFGMIVNTALLTVIFAICALLSLYLSRAIGTPIRKLTDIAADLAEGHIEIDFATDTQGVGGRTNNEIVLLTRVFRNLADSLKAKAEVALAIANGDLTVEVPLQSKRDALGNSLMKMRHSLYSTIKDLQRLAKDVRAEATALEQANQAIVDNTSRSADQLREISDSAHSLHSQTQQNAEDAKNAATLTKSASDVSNQGKEKMGRMVGTMDAITKSSSDIKSIIKVIDDIAFQTNLLALNAAVEAARAGQHGKGFAVVAEEVRNLAARSAKAAKETATLIEESIRQVEQGSRGISETSESLNGITEQVEQISKIVSTISTESARQAEHLGTMTATVGQVTTLANANLQSVNDVTAVISAVSGTVQSLEALFGYFKANQDGTVT